MTEHKTEIAAIDLGSNSFHMAIAHLEHGEVRIQERLGEKVQLASGLDAYGNLDDASIERALACLEKFAQRLRSVDRSNIRIVGTNALRVAKNRQALIAKAKTFLSARIEVISGREEARLIYLGVAHTTADDLGKRLVIDIGGGSTEFIIGERFESVARESLHMGCVSLREKFFPNGSITESSFNNAVLHAQRELLAIKQQYRRTGWDKCVGASGSIKAIFQALGDENGAAESIDRASLDRLTRRIIKLGSVDKLDKLNVKKERLSIFPAGLAILVAAFKALDIDSMKYTTGALREGLLYDMLGRKEHEDVRDRSINALQKRYGVDIGHSDLVAAMAQKLYEQTKAPWQLETPRYAGLLNWASKVYEIGLAIAHNQFHKHGAYIIQHADLSGFASHSQLQLSLLVRAHRRKIPEELFKELAGGNEQALRYLVVLFRLAVALTADRVEKDIPARLDVEGKTLNLNLGKAWLKEHPLTAENLDLERFYLKKIGFSLSFC